MSDSPLTPHLATPAELKERLEFERAGEPFLVYRDADGSSGSRRSGGAARLRSGAIRTRTSASIGTSACPGWHAELRRMGSQWLVVDDGLSRNGTFVNEERVVGRKRLRDPRSGAGRRAQRSSSETRSARPRKSTAAASAAHRPTRRCRRRSTASWSRCAAPSASERPLRSRCRPRTRRLADELFLSVRGGQDAPAPAVPALRCSRTYLTTRSGRG